MSIVSKFVDRVRGPLQRGWDWARKILRRIRLSAEHVEAIRADLKWFIERLGELEPEARLRIESIEFHFEKLEEILGFG